MGPTYTNVVEKQKTPVYGMTSHSGHFRCSGHLHVYVNPGVSAQLWFYL